MLQTNVEYDDIVAYLTSPTKCLKIDPQSACASSVECTCRRAGNIFDKDPKSRWSSMWENKQYILFTDYTRRIMDSSYTELEDMTTSQSNRFYVRAFLLGILYFVTPVGIF